MAGAGDAYPYLDDLAGTADEALTEVKTAAQAVTITMVVVSMVAVLALGIATAALVRADR